MIEVSMLRVMIGFWAGRAIADTFYVWTTSKAFDSFGEVFGDFYQDWQAVALQLLGLAGAAILLLVPWPRWVFRWINRGEREKARA
jgi:hypothetical protein